MLLVHVVYPLMSDINLPITTRILKDPVANSEEVGSEGLRPPRREDVPACFITGYRRVEVTVAKE